VLLKGCSAFVDLWTANRHIFVKSKWNGNEELPCKKEIATIRRASDLCRFFTNNSYRGKHPRWSQGRIGLIIKHELVVGNGRYEYNKVVTDWRKKKISFVKGKFSDAFKDSLPVKLTKHSKLLGRYQGGIPMHKGKTVRNSLPFAHFIRATGLKINKIQVTLPGSFKYSSANLNKMVEPNKTKLSYDDLLMGLKNRGKFDLCLPDMSDHVFDSNDIFNVKVNKKAYNGIQTSKMFGPKMKDSIRWTMPISKRIVDDCIVKKLRPDVSLWAVGGKAKRIDLSPEQDKFQRTRVILQSEDSLKLIGLMLLQPFTDRFKRLPPGALMIGHSIEDGKYLDFQNYFINDDENLGCIDCDWSQFDNHVYEELIVSAFGVIRACFPIGVEYDNYFLYQAGSMIFKHIVMPGSKLIYRIDKGLPTGHPYTSMVGSIINWLLWSTGMSKTIPEEYLHLTRIKSLGDDTIVQIPHKYLSDFESFMRFKTGMSCDQFRHRCGPLSSNLRGASKTFLRKEYNNGFPVWHYDSLFDNLLYPTSVYNLTDERQRIKMLMYTAPFEGEATSLLTSYYEFITRLIVAKIKITSMDEFEKRLVAEKKRWNASLRIARSWFVGIRNHSNIGIRDDDWERRLTHVYNVFNDIPEYLDDYGFYISVGDTN
jgi:hypothetical protein